MMIEINNPGWRKRFEDAIRKHIQAHLPSEAPYLTEQVKQLIVDVYKTSETKIAYDSMVKFLADNSITDIASLDQVISSISINGNEIIVDLSDPKVNRVFRALELYGNAPFQNIKNKLSVLGRWTVKGL